MILIETTPIANNVFPKIGLCNGPRPTGYPMHMSQEI